MNYAESLACMGGRCAYRERCARYHAPYPARENPMERVCSKKSYSMFLAMPAPAVAGTYTPFAMSYGEAA